MTNITEESYNPFNIHHRIGYPFFRSYTVASELHQLSNSLGLNISLHDILRAVRICKQNRESFFRIGGACFDMGIGFQKAAIRCDIGPFAGCSITAD